MGLRGPQNERLVYFVRHAMEPSDECRDWPFALAQGYGLMRVGDRSIRVSALICEAWHGPRPPEAHAAHSCGNAACWAGEHIRWATPAENEADKALHGTRPLGERHHRAKLRDVDVLTIRERHASGVTATLLASEYNVSIAQISNIVRRLSWSHI